MAHANAPDELYRMPAHEMNMRQAWGKHETIVPLVALRSYRGAVIASHYNRIAALYLIAFGGRYKGSVNRSGVV